MHGKLFLLALVCVSFVQVRGDAQLDKKIQEAIVDIMKMLDNIYTESTVFEQNMLRIFRQKDIRSKENLAEAAKQEVLMNDFLKEMVRFFKKEAQTSNQSVLSCIDKVFRTSSQKVGNVTLEVRSRLHGEHVLFNQQSNPLLHDNDWVQRVCRNEYFVFEKRIKNCTKVQEVDNLVEYYGQLSYVVLRFIQKTNKEIQPLLKTYDEKVEQLHRDYREEMENLKTDSVEEMRKCVLSKAAITRRTAFLQFITTH